MKTIKIFLASSEELTDDRNAFGNLVRRLDKIYEKRGIRIELSPWEDFDAAYNNRRKQDEYNEIVKTSDMFLALFHTKAGKFTIEEFDIAIEEFRKKAAPKVYTYCKDLKEGEQESPELVDFKRKLFEELGHYWCRYDNRDSMQLHFIMQLQLIESSDNDEPLKIENGVVMFEDMRIANINHLRFAYDNKDYQRMNTEFLSLPPKIREARKRVERYPEDDSFADELQRLLDHYHKLRKDIVDYQQVLINTAIRISKLQSSRITDRMRRAIELFNDGKIHEANLVLDEAKNDANLAIERYKRSLKIVEDERENVFLAIEELLLKATTNIADLSIPLEERLESTDMLYKDSIDLATSSNLDIKKYINILHTYLVFLDKYARYEKANKICNTLIELVDSTDNQELVGAIYSYISTSYAYQGKLDDAIEYGVKAVEIAKSVYDGSNINLVRSYNTIGGLYSTCGKFKEANIYLKKALDIIEESSEINILEKADVYNNLGAYFATIGEYKQAEYYLSEALNIRLEKKGKEDSDTIGTYISLAGILEKEGDYDRASDIIMNCIEISVDVLGERHPKTACLYHSLGDISLGKGDDTSAMESYNKELFLLGKTIHTIESEASCKMGIGRTYLDTEDYSEALEWLFKARDLFEQKYSSENPHPNLVACYGNIGVAYAGIDDMYNAIDYYKKSLDIFVKVYGANHIDIAGIYNNIGTLYNRNNEYDFALEFYHKALCIYEEKLGVKNLKTASVYNNIGMLFLEQGKYVNALDWLEKSKTICFEVCDIEHPLTLKVLENIETVNKHLEDKQKAHDNLSSKEGLWSRLFRKK